MTSHTCNDIMRRMSDGLLWRRNKWSLHWISWNHCFGCSLLHFNLILDWFWTGLNCPSWFHISAPMIGTTVKIPAQFSELPFFPPQLEKNTQNFLGLKKIQTFFNQWTVDIYCKTDKKILVNILRYLKHKTKNSTIHLVDKYIHTYITVWQKVMCNFQLYLPCVILNRLHLKSGPKLDLLNGC